MGTSAESYLTIEDLQELAASVDGRQLADGEWSNMVAKAQRKKLLAHIESHSERRKPFLLMVDLDYWNRLLKEHEVES